MSETRRHTKQISGTQRRAVQSMQQKTEAGIRWFDFVIFAVLAFLAHLVFQEGDIRHTSAAGYAILNGHITDLYSYTQPVIGACVYMPTTYFLFAIWNAPLRILGIQTEVTTHVSFFVQFWATLLPIAAYIGCGLLLIRIMRQVGFSRKRARVAAYAFMSTPIAFYSQFIFCQYDSITLFFVLLGTYYYFKDDMWKFSLFFGVAMTCKYLALLVYAPMLLLKEKDLFRAILHAIVFMLLFLVERLFYTYFDGAMFNYGVGGFGALNYIFYVGFPASVNVSLSMVMLGWVAVCGWAFFVNTRNRTEVFQWYVYLESFVMFITFGLSFWHPQWTLLCVPFLVMGSMMHKRNDAFWALDLIFMGVFVLYTFAVWPNDLTQNLFELGILNEVIGPRYHAGKEMSAMFGSVFNTLNPTILFSMMSAILLVNALFKHPKYQISDPSEEISSHTGWLRFRFLAGICCFLIPALFALHSMLDAPYAFSTHIQSSYEPEWVVPLQQDDQFHTLEQHFIAEYDSVERLDCKFDDGNLRRDWGEVKVQLVDCDTEEVLTVFGYDMTHIITAITETATFDPVPLEKGHEYKWVFTTDAAAGGMFGLYYTPELGGIDGWITYVDDSWEDYVLAADAFGR